MENKSAVTSTKRSMKGWVFAGIGLVLAVIIYLVVGSAKSTTSNNPNTDTDKAAKEAADKAAKEAADKAAKEAADKAAAEKAKVDEIYTNPPRYKRPSDALSLDWQVPTKAELDTYVSQMRLTGWSDDLISYGAAWLKGMSLPINSEWAIKSYKSIKDFKSKVPNLPRNNNFVLEVQNFPFLPGDLIDDGHTTFSQLKF